MVTKITNSNPDMSVNIFEDDSFGEKTIQLPHSIEICIKLRQLVGQRTIEKPAWKGCCGNPDVAARAADDWQRLQKQWHNFIDKLLQNLENSDHCDSLAISPNCLIVLPIDDLDLQVTRTRELLLALRVLRHNRLVYLLTGYAENTDQALTTSFYRDFIDRTSIE